MMKLNLIDVRSLNNEFNLFKNHGGEMTGFHQGEEVEFQHGGQTHKGKVMRVFGDKMAIKTNIRDLAIIERSLDKVQKPGQKKPGADLLYDDSAS